MQKKLTKLQSFNAVAKLLQIYFDRKPSSDLAIVLTNMSFLKNKHMIDSIMWEIWLKSLSQVIKIQTYKKVTIEQAFIAMGLYLEDFLGTEDIENDMIFLQYNIRNFSKNKLVDPVLFKEWQECVREVLAVKDSRAYFYISPKKQ